VVTFDQAMQELNPDNSLINNGEFYWEFERDLLGSDLQQIYVVVDGKRTEIINI